MCNCPHPILTLLLNFHSITKFPLPVKIATTYGAVQSADFAFVLGIRWYFIVLCLTASIWIASSLNSSHRQKRQSRNAFYLQQLHNGRYMPPIPIRIPPYYKEVTESNIRSSPPKRNRVPWTPIDGISAENSNKNVYVPPLRPQPLIVTRKPLKTTFDVPLTKSIQVSHIKPNIQTVSYINKHLDKARTPRTTEHPRLKQHGTLAESTVQTLLNFTPADDRWRPKVFASSQSKEIPNRNFGSSLGSKVEKHLNNTGVRFRKVTSVIKAMPQNNAAVRVLKNETSFVTKFTPEDVKFRPIEVNKKKVDTPYNENNPEVKHQTEEQKIFFDGYIDTSKTTANLRNEGIVPYQGQKTRMEKVSATSNSALNSSLVENYKDRKTVFDSFQNLQKLNDDFTKVDNAQSQGSFSSKPYNAEKIISASTSNKRERNHANRTQINQQLMQNNQRTKYSQINIPNSQENHRDIFIEPPNIYAITKNHQIESNFPYQGHATVINRPSLSTNYAYGTQNKVNLPYQIQNTHHTSSKPVISSELTPKAKKVSDYKKIYDDAFKSILPNEPINYGIDHSVERNKDFFSVIPSANGGDYKYHSIANSNKNNDAFVNDTTTVLAIPPTVWVQHNISNNITNLANAVETLNLKNKDRNGDIQNGPKINNYQSSPNFQPPVSTTSDIFSPLHNGQSTTFIANDKASKKPSAGQLPKLKEVELKNPPEYLDFNDDDFLKPVIPVNFDKNKEKKLSTFTFSLTDKSAEINKQNPSVRQEIEKKVPKISTEVPVSKVEYYENSKFEDKKPAVHDTGNVYFQPFFPPTPVNNHQVDSQQKFQNYNDEKTSEQMSDDSKEDASRSKLAPNIEKESSNVYDTFREKHKINKDVIITKNANFSPEDTKTNKVFGPSNDMPKIITPPTVITVQYEPKDSENLNNKSRNRTDNYIIQRKPALTPESSNRPRKPNITISTGMLAGILIAALVFLGFLTGSMVYAFHQWKFGRKKNDRQKKKKARNPGFPPEYLDENFAGNTYIHNNIFLPTPQNVEDRNTTDPDASSMTGEELSPEPTSASARIRRHPIFRETIDD